MASSRRQYPFHLIEPKWQQFWDEQQTFRAFNPGEVLPDGHPFARRHNLSGKVAATQLPPKFYILDMFPYPSGAGLHVGHPEGYTATDILARYKRAQGFHVLHPMGWDAFGLPAEQYAVKTGQHPRNTTEANIATFKRQIQSLGFSYDWSRELATTDPNYFKWTQWIFLKLYNSWFNPKTNRAEPIETLKYPAELQQRAAGILPADQTSFPAGRSGESQNCRQDAGSTLEARHRACRDSKRLAYVSEQPVWWCEALGTVLANEEVVDGKSEVGGFPVTRKPMRQWMLRITAYAEKLLADLGTIDWSDSLKEMQRNWIGRSEGAQVEFQVADPITNKPIKNLKISVFTTRPDTLFGATYLVIAPEHIFLDGLMQHMRWPENTPSLWKGKGESWSKTQTQHDFTPDQIFDLPPVAAVWTYRTWASAKSDLERTELAKEKTGVFTGLCAINPMNEERIPIFMADYVLASYGTGAIMAVPAHDERDQEFAKKFSLPIRVVVEPLYYVTLRKSGDKSFVANDGEINSKPEWKKYREEAARQRRDVIEYNPSVPATAFVGFGIGISSPTPSEKQKLLEICDINGLPTAEAKKKITAWLESKGLGKKTVNFKLRDWLFSRQRYWGEPFPIVWKRDTSGNLYHEALPESALPVLPPKLDDYKPMPDGQPPLARAKDWVNLPDGSTRETNTMPQWAGSCWYYLRYLDAKNAQSFVSKEAEQYWMGTTNPSTLNPQPSTKSTPWVS